jgi:hypothetical protein
MPRLFRVVDAETGAEPDLEEIALHEPWARGLIYCDMKGWAIEEDGALLLLDECRQHRYPPAGRFRVEWLPQGEVVLSG